MRHRRAVPFLLTVLIVVLVAFMSGSCSQLGRATDLFGEAIDVNRPQFEFILGGSEREYYWKQVKAGATAASEDYNVGVAFHVISDPSLQGDAIQRIASGDDAQFVSDSGAIIALTDPSAVLLQLRSLSQAGIPVSILDMDARHFTRIRENIVPIAYLGQSPRVSAQVIAKWLRDTDSTRALCIVHRSDIPSLSEQCSVLENIIEGDIELITVPLGNATTIDEYENAFVERMQGIQNIDFVITLNAEVAELVADMVDLIGPEVRIGTFGVNDTISSLLENRELAFAISHQPFLQGYLAVVYLYLHIQYGIAATEIPQLTGPQIFDSGTITLLSPYIRNGTR